MTDLSVILSAVVALLVVLPLAGVLSATETALGSLSVARVESLVKDDRPGSSRLLQVVQDRPDYINLLVLLRTVCEASAAVLVTVAALDTVHDRSWSIAVSVVVVTLLIYVVVGVVSRTVGRRNPYSVSLRAGTVLVVVRRVLGPLSRVLVWFGGLVTPGRGLRTGPFATEIELREMVDIAQERGVVEIDERRMIQSVFDLADTTAREIMVPRPEILWIEDDKTVAQAVRLCVRSGLSRVPVVGDSVDDVLGVVYLKDLVAATYDASAADRAVPVRELMREPVFVPDSRNLDDLLEDMQRDQVHIAVLIDEYGGTAGLVSIEDILEEIVGEISDEYDDGDDVPVERISDGVYRVEAWMSLNDLAELYEDVDLEFSDEILDEVDTVAGLAAYELGKVPLPGAELDVAGLHLTCEGGRDRRGRIKVRTVVVSGPTRPTRTTGDTHDEDHDQTNPETHGHPGTGADHTRDDDVPDDTRDRTHHE
ncbi:hemolysin family protein [Corynebacteriaceae bacterium 7-707]